MCEKCINPKLDHVHDDKAVKPLQKKLSTATLKGKFRKVKKSS